MIQLIKKVVKNILIYFKYRNIKFKKIGQNVNYRFLKSNFHYSENIIIEDDVQIGDNADLDGRGGIIIKRGAITAKDVSIISSDHYFDGMDLKALPFDNRIILKETYIGEYVWIGRGSLVLAGVTIGKGAVIGANSVVSKDIPEYAIAVGNPIQVKKYRDKEVFEKLYADEKSVFKCLGHSKVEIDESSII